MITLEALRQHLRNNGYARFITSDESTCLSVLDLLIEKIEGLWRVCETERGQVVAIHVTMCDENKAVNTFLQIASQRVYHLKTCKTTESVDEIEAVLRDAHVPFERNDVPFEGWLRVFVTGDSLLRAQKVVAS